jgi:hypothetical protein
MQIEETYVSLALAKLAREKGFDVHMNGAYVEYLRTTEYNTEGTVKIDTDYGWNSMFTNNQYYTMYSRPTLELLKAWAMERYEVFIASVPVAFNDTTAFDYTLFYDYKQNLDKQVNSFVDEGILFDTYQEAMEAGLTYVLTYVRN